MKIIVSAVRDIMDYTMDAFVNNNFSSALYVEPIEQVVDDLKKALRTSHITRMQQGLCTIEAGFIWSDLLTNLERTSDHCSNIASLVSDTSYSNYFHESLRQLRTENEDYKNKYIEYSEKYSL